MLRSEVRKASISINEVYPSIQGEGLLVGLPSLFIRIQGCNLRCPWCDQPSALPFKSPSTSLEDLINLVETYPHKHVIITGGEPLTESSLPELVKELLKIGKSVQIETNGTLWQEALMMSSEEFQENFARALYLTIVDYFFPSSQKITSAQEAYAPGAKP